MRTRNLKVKSFEIGGGQKAPEFDPMINEWLAHNPRAIIEDKSLMYTNTWASITIWYREL